MAYYTRGETLNVKGARELADHFRKIGASDDVITAAFAEHGKAIVTAAQGLAPQRTGALRGALSSTPTAKGALVSAGSERVPYAYTFHSGVVGKSPTAAGDLTPKTSGGYMVFRVTRHTRKGSTVSGYSALRPIKQDPYLYRAFNNLLADLGRRVEAAVTKVVNQ